MMEGLMGSKPQVAELLAKATKYRTLARSVTDRETVGRIWDLTVDLEKQAHQIARMLHQEDIRTRAHQIWQQNNCPAGRDDEFWFQAEREMEERS
jgi:hypothetical protein